MCILYISEWIRAITNSICLDRWLEIVNSCARNSWFIRSGFAHSYCLRFRGMAANKIKLGIVFGVFCEERFSSQFFLWIKTFWNKIIFLNQKLLVCSYNLISVYESVTSYSVYPVMVIDFVDRCEFNQFLFIFMLCFCLCKFISAAILLCLWIWLFWPILLFCWENWSLNYNPEVTVTSTNYKLLLVLRFQFLKCAKSLLCSEFYLAM